MAIKKLGIKKFKSFVLFFKKRFSITSWPFLVALLFLIVGLIFQPLWILSAIGGFIIFVYFVIWIVWIFSKLD